MPRRTTSSAWPNACTSIHDASEASSDMSSWKAWKEARIGSSERGHYDYYYYHYYFYHHRHYYYYLYYSG